MTGVFISCARSSKSRVMPGEFGTEKRTYSSIIHAAHTKKYINDVVLVMSFSKEESLNNLKNEYQTDIDPSKQHFLSEVNHFVGLRITRKQSELEDNSDETSKEVIKKVMPAIHGSSEKRHKTEMKNPVKARNKIED
eukprot:TRINITY_DN2477_c0_g1_i15.p1 TRINITY_DN2477_c0_g1~~TRINITY_DN2477_c0_g1_i15.p1  ORF type:complete len:137 (-),score=32.02 TRINITY_DN2477_c0_g1_i15:163-573(-)